MMPKSSLTRIALATFVMVAVTGCEAIQSNPKAAIGAAGGAALGAAGSENRVMRHRG